MTGPIPVEVAREQLRELISILGELRNAGPRDQRFKQWRQITVTLLQRIWPGDPTRADRFRRIPFSAPTAKTDREATREYFERGCKEASLYLSGLAVELGCDIDPMADVLSNYDDNAMPTMGDDDVVDLPNPGDEDAVDQDDEMSAIDDMIEMDEIVPVEEPASPPARVTPAPPAPRATDDARVAPASAAEAQPNWSEVWKAASGPQPKLKDMLGFTDEAISEMTPAAPAAEPALPPSTATVTPSAPPPSAPVSFVPVTPSTGKDEATRSARKEPRAPARPVPAPTPMPELVAEEDHKDLETRFVMESAVLQALAHSTPELDELEEMLAMSAPSPAAQDVMTLAGQVEELGVPARERPIVRAALIDLARQMDSPPVHWGALRETVAFAMDHPDLARRVLPLVLPYLDLAA